MAYMPNLRLVVPEALEMNETVRCARLLVGMGDDTYDPDCVRERGHGGSCAPACGLCHGGAEVRWHGGDATWITCPDCGGKGWT
jgi:hypothetical protein